MSSNEIAMTGLELHEYVLDLLLKYRRSHPDLRFWLRKRDVSGRLSKGYWFQGNDNYAFLGLYDRGGGTNMTRSVGIVFKLDEDKIEMEMEIVHNEETNTKVIDFYHKAVDVLGGFDLVGPTKYYKKLPSDDPERTLFNFLDKDKPVMDALIREIGIEQLFITQKDFDHSLERILSIRNTPSPTIISTPNEKQKMNIPLNRILYGPPGTGKTHHTINAAVEICDPEFYAQHSADRTKVKARYEDLRMKDWKNVQGPGRIGFCTFHQSFSYEDFVEGIKPMKPVEGDPFLKYEVRPGVLKQMVQRAEFHASGEATKVKHLVSFTPEEMDKAEFYKLSLGDTQNADDQVIYDYCIENNVIAIGFLGQHDLTGLTEQEIRNLPLEANQSRYDHTAMSYFTHYLKEGNYVVITSGNFVVRAIGRITGEYYYDPKSEIGYPHFRKVEWLVKNEAIPAMEIYGIQFSQQTIYKLKKDYVQRDFFVKSTSSKVGTDDVKNFVLIIDEINRGNVAGIFGELITLIEENKRKGKPEALEVTLPYSQEPFSIPDNLYIIGTMNTADRSVEALDAALRRRFSFAPMMPDTKDLKLLHNSKVDLHALLKKINERLVQFLDEDHQIGHSHFWELHKAADPIPELQQVFADKIIPQLEEYFHRDRARLRLVLGDAFVEKVEADEKLFTGDSDDIEFELRPTYRLRSREQWTEAAFMAIYG